MSLVRRSRCNLEKREAFVLMRKAKQAVESESIDTSSHPLGRERSTGAQCCEAL